MAKVEIYTTLFCPYCDRAKALLARKGVAFEEMDAPHGSQARRDAIERSGGRTTVPQIFINGQAIGGSDDLVALERAGKLDALAASAPTRNMATGMANDSLAALTGGKAEGERLPGTIATNVLALERGAAVFRVHDVAQVADALRVAGATLAPEAL